MVEKVLIFVLNSAGLRDEILLQVIKDKNAYMYINIYLSFSANIQMQIYGIIINTSILHKLGTPGRKITRISALYFQLQYFFFKYSFIIIHSQSSPNINVICLISRCTGSGVRAGASPARSCALGPVASLSLILNPRPLCAAPGMSPLSAAQSQAAVSPPHL